MKKRDNNMKNFPSLHPYFITGFIDAEGCFNLYFRKDQRCQNGYQVQLSFKISVHEKDRPLLELIQSYFGVGTISKHGQDSVQYQVRSLGDLAILIDHFYKYPLITQKQADYKLFKLAVDLMNHKEHLKIEGLQKIIAIKGSMNLGLSEELRAAFPNVTLVQRPLVQLPEKIDPDWVAGFTCGEGCFMINIVKSSTHKMGERINLMFRITQHSRDAELMKSLEQYFGCGKYQEKSKGQASQSQVGVFIVANYSDITGKINPFFTKYPLHGVKSLDFADFKKAAELMEAKAHLTESGLEKIRLIKALRALGWTEEERLKLIILCYPWFITGFTDAEGCFHVGIGKNNRFKTKWEVQPEFKIELHRKDIVLLKSIQEFFGGVGKISQKGDSIRYRVRSLKELIVILAHFEKYPLITQKWADYELFKSVVKLMELQEHVTAEGLRQILSLRASMNKGLPEKLKADFPDIIPVPRPLILSQDIKDPHWLAGFVSGEGCFLIDVYTTKTKTGLGATLRFKLSQHSRDAKLMKSLEGYLGCGNYYPKSNTDIGDFIVGRFGDNLNKIIPFFDKYLIKGIKALDFADFKRAAELIENKAHLTEAGLEKIRLIKALRARGWTEKEIVKFLFNYPRFRGIFSLPIS